MIYRDLGPSSSGALHMKPLSHPIYRAKRPEHHVGVGGLKATGSLGVHVATNMPFPFFVY